jgi:hypothetical protein
MNRGLKFLAALIGTIMVVVPFAGLDSLPRDVRAQIAGERQALAGSGKKLQAAQQEVARDLEAEPELFASIPAAKTWNNTLGAAQSEMQAAGADVAQLTAIEKVDRRGDKAKAEALLVHERQLRAAAESRAAGIEREAAHWVELKRNLPATLEQMERDYDTLQAFDASALTATVEQAGAAWPEKKGELEARLAALRGMNSGASGLWQQTAEARRQAATGKYAGLDFGTLLGAAETLRTSAGGLRQKSGELTALAGQLDTAWDKLLVDMDVRGSGSSRSWEQKIRTITTRDGKSTSDERWVQVPKTTYEGMKDNLGMAIAHKPAGKFDSEADQTPQPAGFAYVATPAQGRNQYGYWERRDGRDFWVFYGQYALMRDLLFNRDYRPLETRDWDGYRSSRERGQTYYGQDKKAPQYGTGSATTQQRYSGSTFDRNGGFKDSKYASKSGNYRDSEYSTPAARNPNADSAPRRFGNGNSSPQASRPPSRTFRPSPAPSRAPSAPRRFGRR